MSAYRVGVLAYPGCFASEVFGIPDLLTMAAHVAGPDRAGYEVTVISPRRRVVASGGVALSVSPLREVDILVVPGFELVPGLDPDARLPPLTAEIAAIRAHAAAGGAVVSICVGAFLLARAGLLAGRKATTAWLFADELAQQCPEADIRPDRLVVTDRGVTTPSAPCTTSHWTSSHVTAARGSRGPPRGSPSSTTPARRRPRMSTRGCCHSPEIRSPAR
ncbi:DJ-1/PfpI family protein [Nocardia nova]|uniref:DJ-1/PfpI family protein n=1 Tax=Nocardia nova TaxID=37330 RepID=UPI001FE44F95|nr:DJ-1/PfpI family protein [Nocardia nova]